MPVNEPTPLSADEAARLLGISRTHVESLVARGTLKAQQTPGAPEIKLSEREVLKLREAREEAKSRGREFSRRLDRLGAPPE